MYVLTNTGYVSIALKRRDHQIWGLVHEKESEKHTGKIREALDAEVGMLQQQRKKPRARAKERTLDSAELLQGLL